MNNPNRKSGQGFGRNKKVKKEHLTDSLPAVREFLCLEVDESDGTYLLSDEVMRHEARASGIQGSQSNDPFEVPTLQAIGVPVVNVVVWVRSATILVRGSSYRGYLNPEPRGRMLMPDFVLGDVKVQVAT